MILLNNNLCGMTQFTSIPFPIWLVYDRSRKNESSGREIIQQYTEIMNRGQWDKIMTGKNLNY